MAAEGYDFPIGAKCIIEQYEMLTRCSERKDIKEWNDWRDEHPDEAVCLQGADLRHFQLPGANLHRAKLEGALLWHTNLQGANLHTADFQGAVLWWANLQSAQILYANLRCAGLCWVNLQDATLSFAHMQGARLLHAHLQRAKLLFTSLQDAPICGCKLAGAQFRMAVVDGGTIIQNCEFDRQTDFRGVGLDATRIEPGLKQGLEYNNRRLGWLEWYSEGPLWQRPFKHVFVRPFWCLSNYGASTGRIIFVFFALSLAFAIVYWAAAMACSPGVVDNLFPENNPEAMGAWMLFLRAVYFSIVTMTTLGFGDMHAHPESAWGHVLLMFQVILGYVLLGSLVTRLAILFTGSGPALMPAKARRQSKANKAKET